MSFNDDDGDGAFICDNEKFERLRIGRLRTDRETIQAKTYKNWINSVLIKARTSIDEIYTDLADGQKLLLLLELITGEKIAEPSRGSSVLHKIENVSRCLKFIRSKDVYLESIGPEDIVNGNKRLTLGLIWTIILRFQLSQHLDFVQFDLKTIKDSLLLWCQSKTSKSTKCRVRDFKRSWSDGWAFVELVRSFRPDLIDPASMSKCSSVQMLDKAFDVANQHLMIPSILDAEDVATSADENSILTYISYFYNLYCRNKTTGTGSKRIKFIITQLSEVQSIQSSYEAQVSELMAWIKERTAHFASDIDINEAQEKMSQFNNYFWTERPEKLKARNDAESLYLDIANMHKKRGLRPFVPKANLSVKDLEKAWQHLEEVERRRQSQLKEKIVKYEQLTQAMDEFDLKCLKLENYISEKMALLNQIYEWKSTDSDDQSTNLSSLEVYLKQSELICCDIVSNSAKFDSIFKLTNQLIEHRYKNYEFVKMCCRHLKAKLKNLTDMAVRNQRTIDSTTKTIHYLKRLDCVKVELEQLTANLTLLPHNRTDSVQNVFSNLEKCKQYETELRLLERQFLVVQSRLFLLTDNNNHQSSVLIEPTLFQQRLSLIRSSLDQCRRLLEQHITSNHQNLDYNEFSEEIEYLQMFFSEKTILCQSSLDVCYDSTSIFSLQQRHNIIKLEVRTVEKQFFAACEKGYRLMAKANYYNPLVNEPIEQTKLSLRRLMRLVNERTYLINDSIQLIRLVDQLGEMHLLKGEDIHQTVTNCLREADEMGQLELTELSELLERINGLSVSAEHITEQHHWATGTTGRTATTITTSTSSSNSDSDSSSAPIHLVHLKEYSQSAVVVDHRHAFLVLRLEQSVHSLPHDIHCRLLRVVTDNFRAAQQLLTATAVDVDEDRLRRLLLPERKTQADSAGNDNCHRNDDDEDERLRSLPSTCANLNLQETERMVDLFLSGDNRLEHFIGSLQERQAMTQSDMASMNELMAFVRHTLQLLKVTQTFTRTFVQVKTDQQRHSRHFHKLRRSQAQSSIAPADDPSDDKTTSTPPLQLTPTSPDYQSKLNPEAFKFKVVTYKLQQNLNFIGNYLGTVNDDNATALAFKLNFSSDLIRKNFAQLSQLLTAEENLASLELRQEAEKTAALIDSVVQNETLMGGKVATLQRLEAVEDFFQTMADSVKQIGQIRPDADQVTVRRHVRQMKTMTVTLQSHFEELVNGASSLNEHHTADYNDVKLYESRITNLKHQFTQFQKVISQKSELCRQRLEQLTPDKIQISKMTTLNQQKRETSDSNRVDDQQFDSVTITEANQVPKNRKSAPEQTQKDDLESQLSIAELVLFEMESAGGSVSQSKFAETMAICDNALLNNPLTANDDSLIQRIDNLKNQLTRAWNNQMKQNEMKQFNLLSTEFMTTCKQKIETVKSLHYECQEIANCKQMVVQLQLDQRAIYEQFRLSKSEEIVSRLVQLHDALAKYEQMVNEKEIVAETMAQLNDITQQVDSIKPIDSLNSLEDLLKEIDASINVRNKASLSKEHQFLLIEKSMELKKLIIEKQMKIKLRALVKRMSCLTEPDEANACSILKSTIENLLKSSEQLSVKNFNYCNKIDELLLNWSLIKDSVDRISELIENTSVQTDVSMAATNLSSEPQNVNSHLSLDNSSQKQSIYSQQPESSTSTDIDHNEPISSKSPISTMEFLHPFTSSTTLTLPPLVEDIQPESSDDHLTTAETTPAELVSPEVEMSTEFDTKASGRVGTRSSLESDFSADYLLSVKDFGSMQTSSEENFANNLTESTLSLYYSESDSGHCELNYNINSSESRGDHQTGVCTECQQSTDPNKHPPLAVGTSQQTISSSYASLPINATEYIESSDDHKESENEHSEEPEHVTTSNDRQLETDCQTAQQMCTDMWTTVESAFEKINNLIVKKNYSANQQTQQLLNDISFAISNRQQEEEMFVSLNESTQSISNRVSNMLNTLSHSSRQLKYLVDHELQSLSDLTSKIEGADFSYELLADELDDRGNDKAAPLAEQEDSWMPSEEVNLTQNYVLSKSHQIDFTSTDFESFARGESSLSFASDIESSLHVDESIHPQLEGLEEKVDGIKSELEDIAARIAKHSDGKRLSFEVGNFDEMFEFKGLNSPVPHTEKVLNKSDSIDGSKVENSLPLFDNNNEVCLNDKNSSEISKTPQLETQIENSDLQDVFQPLNTNALTEKSEFQKSDYSNKSSSSNSGSNSGGEKQPTKQEEDFVVGDKKMTSVVDFDELNDDDNDEYLETNQCSTDEKQNTEKISFDKNDSTKADFPKMSQNEANSTTTANIETPNLFSTFVVNQHSTLSTNSLEKQQREPNDDVQLDCLEDKVHQIALQLDIIAEKLVEHVQMNAVDRNIPITDEKYHQNDVSRIIKNDSQSSDADSTSTDCLKDQKEISTIYEMSEIEVYQSHSTNIKPADCQSSSSVLLPVINTEVTNVFKNDNRIDFENAKLLDDFAATDTDTTKDALECSQTKTVEKSVKSTSEIMTACTEQESPENKPTAANFKSENPSNSFNEIQSTNFNFQEAFNGNANTALDKKNETTLLQTTEEITSITNEQIDLNVTQEIAKPNQTVFDEDAMTNLLPDDHLLSENESSANLSHKANENIYSENTNSNVFKSETSFHNNAIQLPDDGPDKLCTQNNEHSTDQQIVNPNLSADVNTQTKSTKQTNECESNVENLNEEPMGSEHLNKLSNSVTADDQSTVDNCRQIELHLSIDDVKPFIENLNANSTVQIEFPPTESLIFNLSDSSTSVSEVERNDLTEAENLGHGYLHLNDDVNQVENIDARLDCLENKICNISCQLDAIAEQLIALVPISQTFENLESDKLPQNSEQIEKIFPATIKHKIIKSKSDFENDKSAMSKNENNLKELVNSANEMPGEKRHITHESSTNKHSISLEFEKVLQKSDLSSSKNAKLLKPNSDKENLEQIFEVPNKVSTENILLNQLKHEKILPMNEQLTTSSKIENNESSTVSNQNPLTAGSFLALQDVAEYKNNIESKNNSEPLMFNEKQNYENQTELQIHQLPPKVIDNQLLKIEHFEENTQESSNIITHLSAKNDKLLPELLTENNNTVSSENKLPDIEKASFEDEKQNLFDIVKENNFEIFSNETLETNCKNEETTNQSYSIDAINTIKQNDEISYLHNYSLSKSHLVNFQSLNTNLKKFNQNTDLKHQSDPITTDNDDLANEISQLPVVCQESSMTVPFPDDLQMNAESNANGAQPLPESTIHNDTFVTEKADILPPNNLTIAKHINSEQHLPANCKTEEIATIDSHQNDLQNNKVIATSRKLNVLSVEKEPLAINSDNESFESINEEQIESLENRISIIAEKLDDIAKNLINIAESQTPSKSKINELNECNKNTSSEKPDLEKLKFEQQIISQHFIQSNHASSNDENEISQQLEHFDLNEAKDCFTKCISDFYSNSTAQPNSELSKEQTRTLLVQPELQTYASSTIKSDCTEADSVEQPSLTTEVQSSNTEQTETCIQNNDESSMQECLTVVNDKQPLNDFNVNNEDTRSCGQTDSNDCATEQRQAGYPSREIETLFGQINNEAHNSVLSKTVTTPESLLPAENINEADMKDDADFIGQPTMETGHSNNLMTYADAVKLSKAGCKVKSEERDSPNVSNLSTQTLSSQISTDELPNSPKNSDHSESSLTDMNRVTCDDDALLEYIETRVDVLDSKISNLTEWFREYCNASKRPEHSEHLIWPKLDMLTIEPASESFEQINQTHSIASEKSDCKENDDSSVEQISGNNISRSNSLSTDDRNVNKDDAFQQNNVCSTDLPAEQENPPAETLHREQDACSACNIFDAELDEIIDNELGPASDENAPLDTKIDSPTETYELNHSELPTLTPNELQSNALPPNCLSEKSNELEQSVNPNHQQKAKEASLEIDSPKEASTEINSSAEKRTKTLIQQPELEQQSSLLHDTQVHDSSTSISTGENLINATLQTDKSSETEQNELGTSTSSMFDEQGRGDASSSVSRENCFTDAQDFKESFERKPRFISDFKQPVLASALRPDILPDMPPIEDVGMECQQPKDTVSEMSPTTEAVTNNPSETSENIPLIDLTSELSPADDSLSVSFNKSALQDVSVGQNVESKVLDSFSKKSKLNVTIKTKQANSSRVLDSEQQFSSNADIPSTVAPTNDIKEIAFENADAHLSDNKSAKNANETFNSEFCNQNSSAAEMVSPGSPILAGEYLADSESVPHEDDDLIAAKCYLNDTDGGIGKEERPLDVRQLSVGDTTDTVGNLSTVPAIDRADIGQAAASVSPQSAIPDSQLMQSKSSSTSRDNILNEPAESQPRPSLPREQPNRPPSGNFFSRNFGRVARYSLPCYLLPLLLLLILLIFPHSESDFNCLMQFDEYRSGIMKTYQDGPPPV